VTKTFAVKLEVGLDIMHLDPHTDKATIGIVNSSAGSYERH
jgi:hypothetical protein